MSGRITPGGWFDSVPGHHFQLAIWKTEIWRRRPPRGNLSIGSRCEPWVSHAKRWAVPGKPPFSETLRALVLRGPPKHVRTDHDPLFRFHRWLANLRVREIGEVKSVPYAPVSHPFVERLIGTIRRALFRTRCAGAGQSCVARIPKRSGTAPTFSLSPSLSNCRVIRRPLT